MVRGHKVVVVMPAYNAAKTIERSVAEVCGQNVADVVVINESNALKIAVLP